MFVADPNKRGSFRCTESLTGFEMMNDEETVKTVLCHALPAWSVRYLCQDRGGGQPVNKELSQASPQLPPISLGLRHFSKREQPWRPKLQGP